MKNSILTRLQSIISDKDTLYFAAIATILAIGLISFFSFISAGVLVLVALATWISQRRQGFINPLKGQRILNKHEAPSLYTIVEELSQRAGLKKAPMIIELRNRQPNAFALRQNGETYIGVTSGLLSQLNQREIAAVLAHEIGHIKNKDLSIKAILFSISRIAAWLGSAGKVLFFANLFGVILGSAFFSWSLVFILLLAPTGIHLFSQAISRNREFKADQEAATLTNNPQWLSSALRTIHSKGLDIQGVLRMIIGSSTAVDMWSSHPNVEERIARLGALPSEQVRTSEPFRSPYQDPSVLVENMLELIKRQQRRAFLR